MISSFGKLVVGDDETGFNRKRISTNGRAEALRKFDCNGKVIGVAIDVEVVVVVVVVVVDAELDVGKTIKSVGGFI